MNSTKTLSDSELIALCFVHGSVDAWSELVERFHPVIANAVYQTARRFGGLPREAAQDVIQDVYLRLCAGRGRLFRDFTPQHEGAYRAYVRTMAATITIDRFRKRNSDPLSPVSELLDENLPDTTGSQDSESIESRLLIEEIDAFLKSEAGISPRDRHVFWLHYRHGLPARAIAEIPAIGLGVKGVESVIFRATRAVRQKFNGNG